MMRTNALPRSRDLSQVAERQLRMWAIGLETRQRLETEKRVPQKLVHPYIAISRETGIDAGEIAKDLADKLGWKILDRELLDYMAEHYQWSRVALDYVDERTASWFHDTFGKWLDQQMVSQAEYVSRLGKLVLLAAQHESNVFVGRGVQFILPRELGLTVRLIAPLRPRIKRVMERQHCSRADAEKFVNETDRGRADFIRRYFQRDVADPRLYDLVINLEYTARDTAIDLILGDYMLRFEPSKVTCAFHLAEDRGSRRL
ncbi:MAG TPA: cytidylate kinase-like family protein [Lacipirellulaceae bacterium]|nr:cytidylate kinase-like family protein [Lacipirellulaceae bacterium]